MANTDRGTGKRRGRPSTPDHLAVYLHVEMGRRRLGLSIREFCGRRDSRFSRHSPSFIGPVIPSNVLRGEALRRRYREARESLGLVSNYRGIVLADDHPLKVKSQAILDRLVDDFMA